MLISYDKPSPELRGQKILLVEDYLESGKSMAFCAQQLAEADNIVRTFAIGYSPDSSLIPDYTAGRVPVVPKLPWD